MRFKMQPAHPEHISARSLNKRQTRFEISKGMLARSRIYLDNFDHITAYWVGLGIMLGR
jgi:2-iminoacetate synthase ThiH